MRHKDLFKTYIWLVETVHRFGPLTLEEICSRWERSSLYDGCPMARTSFNRHRTEIEDLFGIRIACDRSDGWRYSIVGTGDLAGDTVQNWMANTIAINNVIAENRAVHDRILLESIPSEGEALQRTIEAMRHGHTVNVGYRRYDSVATKSFEAEPHCVKLYHRRWYALVRFAGSGDMRVLAFDRITSLTETSRRFAINPAFSAADYFADCYGIVRDPDVARQTVTVRAYGNERHYLRDLPLHPSQRLVAQTDEWADFELTLSPTADFVGHLLSRAEWLKVVSPQWLADEMEARLNATLARYKTT